MPPKVRAIITEEAERHGVSVECVIGRSRTRCYVRPRHDAMRRLRAMGFSYPQIAKWFGRDHTSVIYAINAQSLWRRREELAA